MSWALKNKTTSPVTNTIKSNPMELCKSATICQTFYFWMLNTERGNESEKEARKGKTGVMIFLLFICMCVYVDGWLLIGLCPTLSFNLVKEKIQYFVFIGYYRLLKQERWIKSFPTGLLCVSVGINPF